MSNQTQPKNEMTPKQFLAFREKHGFTQKQIAELLGVTWQAVRLWELGERGIPEMVHKIINLFNKFPQTMKEF